MPEALPKRQDRAKRGIGGARKDSCRVAASNGSRAMPEALPKRQDREELAVRQSADFRLPKSSNNVHV